MALIKPLISLQLHRIPSNFSRLAHLRYPRTATATVTTYYRPKNQAYFHASTRQLQEDTMADRPTGLKANKGIELLTWGTPNGVKASIILEELKEAYGKDYTWYLSSAKGARNQCSCDCI